MGHVTTVINAYDHRKYKISTIKRRNKFPISSGDKMADKIINFGSVQTRYEAAVFKGRWPVLRSLTALIAYWESFQGQEVSLELFHQLVAEVVQSTDLQKDTGKQFGDAFEARGLRVNFFQWRQLFKAFKKANILIVSVR